MKICPIQISTSDDFPKLICEECVEITMTAYQLQKISIESENFFRSQLGELQVVKQEKSEPSLAAVKVETVEEDFRFDDESLSSDNSDDESFEPLKTVKQKSETYFTPRELECSKNLPPREKWYSCNFCEAKLKPRSNILRHMKVNI